MRVRLGNALKGNRNRKLRDNLSALTLKYLLNGSNFNSKKV